LPLYNALSSYCTSRKDFAQLNDRNKLQNDWAEFLKIYRGYISESYVGKAKINIPQTFATTFRMYSAIMSNIRRNRDIVRFVGEPKHDGVGIDSVEAGDTMQQAAAYYIAKGRLLREVGKWELEACTLGTSFLKTTWEFQEGEKPGRESEDGTRPLEPSVVYDGFRFEHRPIHTIFVDPKAFSSLATVDDLEYIIDQRFMSIDKLFSDKRFYNRTSVERATSSNKRTSERDDTSVEQAIDTVMGIGNTGIETRDKESDQIIVEEYWGRVPRKVLNGKSKENFGQDDLKDFVEAYVVLAEGVVVWAQENPYPNGRKPYDVIRCYPTSSMFYGIGIPELIRPLQRGLNAITNQRLDNVGLVLNRMWAYKRNQVNPKHLVSRPGGFIPVRGDISESLMPLVTQDVTQSSYREHEVFDSTIQKVSGVVDLLYGKGGNDRASATEANLQMEQASGMMEEIVAGQVQDGFVPLMEKIRDYIQAFNTSPLTLMVDGVPKTINPEDLVGEFELVPTVGEQMFTKTAEMQKAMMLLQTTLGVKEHLMQEGKQVRVSKILERVFENAGWKDFATIVSGNQQGSGQEGQAGQEGIQEEQDRAAQLSGTGNGAGGAAGAGGGGFAGIPDLDLLI